MILLQDVAFASTTHVTDCNSVSSIAVAGRQELALPAGASLKVRPTEKDRLDIPTSSPTPENGDVRIYI